MDKSKNAEELRLLTDRLHNIKLTKQVILAIGKDHETGAIPDGLAANLKRLEQEQEDIEEIIRNSDI